MPFSIMAHDIKINVQVVRFEHTRKEVTAGNGKVQTNGDSLWELAVLLFKAHLTRVMMMRAATVQWPSPTDCQSLGQSSELQQVGVVGHTSMDMYAFSPFSIDYQEPWSLPCPLLLFRNFPGPRPPPPPSPIFHPQNKLVDRGKVTEIAEVPVTCLASVSSKLWKYT